jgi:hypothetical protein
MFPEALEFSKVNRIEESKMSILNMHLKCFAYNVARMLSRSLQFVSITADFG